MAKLPSYLDPNNEVMLKTRVGTPLPVSVSLYLPR